jgi:hypothetical protein
MKFPCVVQRRTDGKWSLRHESPAVGRVEVTAETREQAADKLCNEIRYRLELCPCTGETYQHIQVEIVEA